MEICQYLVMPDWNPVEIIGYQPNQSHIHFIKKLLQTKLEYS